MLLPSLTAGIIYFLCVVPARRSDAAASPSVGHIALVQKDSSWRPLPVGLHSPTGDVSYSTRGAPFRFTVRAAGLRPGTRYIIELTVDGAIGAAASRAADSAGDVVLDTALSAFAGGTCGEGRPAGQGSDGGTGTRGSGAPALRGAHQIKFTLRRNGRPAVGAPVARPSGTACAGNGDGDFSYILFEEKVAHYNGDK